MKGSEPGTGALAHLFPNNIKSWKPIIYAKDVPLIIWIKKLIVGATPYLKDCGKMISLKVWIKVKLRDCPASHWPFVTEIIDPLQTSERYAEVNKINAIVAANQGFISILSNLGIPKPNRNKSINKGTDWKSHV